MADDTERPQITTRLLIRDFEVTELEDGRFQATALYEVTPRLAEFGCKGIIHADSIPDLEVLCSAERQKVSMIRSASASDPRVLVQAALARYRAGQKVFPHVPPTPNGDGSSGA